MLPITGNGYKKQHGIKSKNMDLGLIAQCAEWQLRNHQSIKDHPSPYEGWAITFLKKFFSKQEQVIIFGETSDMSEIYNNMRYFAYLTYLTCLGKIDLNQYEEKDRNKVVMAYFQIAMQNCCNNLKTRKLRKHYDYSNRCVSIEDSLESLDSELFYEDSFFEEEEGECYERASNFIGVRKGFLLQRIDQSMIYSIPRIIRGDHHIHRKVTYPQWHSIPLHVLKVGDKAEIEFKKEAPFLNGLYKIASIYNTITSETVSKRVF